MVNRCKASKGKVEKMRSTYRDAEDSATRLLKCRQIAQVPYIASRIISNMASSDSSPEGNLCRLDEVRCGTYRRVYIFNLDISNE